jgi:SRSO17 transposase
MSQKGEKVASMSNSWYKNNRTNIQEDLMLHPIICQDERLRQYLQSFRALFSLPQYEHFVTVLMGQLLGEAGHTLSHVHRAVSGKKSLSSLSRFLSDSPWSHQSIIQHNFARFCREMQPKIDEKCQNMINEAKKQKRRGKRPVPFVTGYLIGDDSTMYKPKGRKMQGIGKHHSTTYETQVTGHSLVQCFYTVLDRSCPLEPLLYRQQKTAKKECVSFLSKIDLMIQQIQNFTPPAGTETHVLLDSWYNGKKLWKAALDRNFKITTGIRSNRWLRVSCEVTSNTPRGWKWQQLDEYAASLPESAYQECVAPRNQKKKVYVHVVDTRIRKLYRCKLIIIRKSLKDPISAARFWVTSDLKADAQTCINVISNRWDIEVFFEDMKELLGIDQYQLMTSTALLRYWTLCWIAYSFLESIRNDLKQIRDCKTQRDSKTEISKKDREELGEYQEEHHATLGQARRYVQEIHQELFLEWVYYHALSGTPVEKIHALLAA